MRNLFAPTKKIKKLGSKTFAISLKNILQSHRNRYFLFYALLIAMGTVYAFLNPYAKSSLLPKCMIHSATGFFCAGCGLQRALHEFFQGHWSAAFRLNAFFTLALLLLLVDCLLLIFKLEKWRPLPYLFKNHTLLLIAASLLVVFMVLRNLPMEPFTFLAPKK